jgi:hypothetical protein
MKFESLCITDIRIQMTLACWLHFLVICLSNCCMYTPKTSLFVLSMVTAWHAICFIASVWELKFLLGNKHENDRTLNLAYWNYNPETDFILVALNLDQGGKTSFTLWLFSSSVKMNTRLKKFANIIPWLKTMNLLLTMVFSLLIQYALVQFWCYNIHQILNFLINFRIKISASFLF